MIRRKDRLERLLARAERLCNPAPIRAPRDTPAIYRPPKKTRAGHVCRDCGRPISYFSGRQCVECYRAECRKRYEGKVALRELKMQIARKAGL